MRPNADEHRSSNAPHAAEEVHVGDLGSGSDFTPFLQHIGVPSTDIGSEGPYGVYHSVFDNFAWFEMCIRDSHRPMRRGDCRR